MTPHKSKPLKLKKKQLLEMLSTLESMINFPAPEEAECPEILETLMQCQYMAIAMGSDLELRGETGGKIVRLLEDYCEELYQLSISLSVQTACTALKAQIHSQLSEAQNLIRDGIPEDKKEIVFLPYKASMWDSLESVWMAARDDDSCEAYVVPIPYYDKKPDGSFGQMYYEGNEYPDYVPVTSWEEYDIESRRPDVVFIHNPYDAWNYVTSVHPNFYAEKLKKLVGKLVYIPYFVLNEIEPDDQEEIDKMKHFCFLPGIVYADKVIVQSENMRQIYIEEYRKAAQETGLRADRKLIEEKILGLGSPKYDKILFTGKDDIHIPVKWMAVILKPDGGRKKIVLYNTSVGALLDNDEKMLCKMEQVFHIFKERQQELVLWWRPHPLIGSTIRSMRPLLWEKYHTLVETYQSEGWGIYDDTADIDRAIIVSDAYYGDSSSVVQLYEITKKPVLIQAVKDVGDEAG